MSIEFTATAWKQFNYWVDKDKRKVAKINQLIRSISQDPFRGLGSPEPLKHELKGYWSRRIDSEHRMVYRIIESQDSLRIRIVQCRFHY